MPFGAFAGVGFVSLMMNRGRFVILLLSIQVQVACGDRPTVEYDLESRAAHAHGKKSTQLAWRERWKRRHKTRQPHSRSAHTESQKTHTQSGHARMQERQREAADALFAPVDQRHGDRRTTKMLGEETASLFAPVKHHGHHHHRHRQPQTDDMWLMCTPGSLVNQAVAVSLLIALVLGATAALRAWETAWSSEAEASANDRCRALDRHRGSLVVMMVAFHFVWDLRWFGVGQMADYGGMLRDGVCESGTGSCAEELLGGSMFVVFAVALYFASRWTSSVSQSWGIASVVVGGWVVAFFWKRLTNLMVMRCFSMCVGASSASLFARCVAEARKDDSGPWFLFARQAGGRLVRLAMAAMIVSIATYMADDRAWVSFGALHALCVVSVLHIPVLLRLTWAAPLGLVLAALCFLDIAPEPALKWVHNPTFDYEPVLPNLAFVLLGVGASNKVLFSDFDGDVHNPALERIGQWALPLYLLHQVVLFPLAWSLAGFCNS